MGSWAIRILAIAVPLAASLVVSFTVARLLPTPIEWWQVLGWWLIVLGSGLMATVLVDRWSRRWLPLAALLRLTLEFPDRAPSRFSVARRQHTVASLRRSLAELDADEPPSRARAAEIIIELAAALSVHDPRTRGHAERVRAYTDLISEELGLDEPDRNRLRWAALLHDIGKLRIPTKILNTEASLTAVQWEALRQHPIEGMKIAAPLLEWLGPWAQTIEHHHERWDGTGYPFGLEGEAINFGARIVTVADAYDAMTATRSYQEAVSPAAARAELARQSGKQFDPEVVKALLRVSLARMRIALGPFSWLFQIPVVGGLRRLGRDAVIVGAGLMLLLGMSAAGALTHSEDGPPVEAAAADTGQTTSGGPVADSAPTTSTSVPSTQTSTTVAPTATTTTIASSTVVAVADSAATREDTSVEIWVLDNDTPGSGGFDLASLVVTRSPAFGDVTAGVGGQFTYTPFQDRNGEDVFTYEVCDAGGGCSEADVRVSVSAVNDAPVARNDSGTTNEDVELTLDLRANDGDPERGWIGVTSVTAPANGSVTFTTAGVTYIPDAGFSGTETFDYTLCDRGNSCDSASVTIEVIPVNDPPLAAGDAAITDEDQAVVVSVIVNDSDPDGDSLFVASASTPAHGAVSIGAGSITYTPSDDFYGSDQFTYTVCDPSSACDTATVTVTVVGINDAPTTTNDSVSTDWYTSAGINILANDSDVDGDPLTVGLLGSTSLGSLSLDSLGSLQFTPIAGITGAESVAYEACDDSSVCTTGLINLNVELPATGVVSDDSYTVPPDTVFNVLENDDISILDDATLEIVQQDADRASVIAANGTMQIQYLPGGFSGIEVIIYEVCTPLGDCFQATVTITVS